MNSEKREPWASERLETMYQQYISSGALQANPMSRGAIGAYINALEHELRAALCASSQVPDGRNEVSTEAQPEVTGAVAWLVKFDRFKHVAFTKHQADYFAMHSTSTITPLYPPSAIEGYAQELANRLVREKLEEAARICDEIHWKWRIGDYSGPQECAEAIRALMESPHTSVEEPAN